MAKVLILAETEVNYNNLVEMLQHLGAPQGWETDATNDAELLMEVAGRLCYKSFAPGLNPNVTRVREGNQQYLRNIMQQKHGSVFEHATTTVAFLDVSRILTHELVRHRPAVAFSQESQRFVRLDQFDVYIPDLTDTLTALYDEHYPETVDQAEHAQLRNEWVQAAQLGFLDAMSEVKDTASSVIGRLIHNWKMDDSKVSFHVKKGLTSALRRMAPGGVNTHIMVTTNHRMWRHMIENRTAPGAEQEIVEVFGNVARQFRGAYPNIYQDMIEQYEGEDLNALPHFKFINQKI